MNIRLRDYNGETEQQVEITLRAPSRSLYISTSSPVTVTEAENTKLITNMFHNLVTTVASDGC
jgi:hypothetical protein